MKHFSVITLFALVCIFTLSSCGGDATNTTQLTETDKRGYDPQQAVEALYNTLPDGDINQMKQTVKFKEEDKLSDSQKDDFFKKLCEKKFKVEAKKAKDKNNDGVIKVKCKVTFSNGSSEEKKFKVVKEDDIWKTIIGYSEIQDAIYK